MKQRDVEFSDPTLKHFRSDDFHAVCGLQEEFRSNEPDEEEGFGFKRGDVVGFGVFSIADFKKHFTVGKVTGIRGEFVRIAGELYHHSVVEKI